MFDASLSYPRMPDRAGGHDDDAGNRGCLVATASMTTRCLHESPRTGECIESP